MKIKKEKGKAVHSIQVNKGMTFYVHMFVKNVCIIVQRYIFRQCFSPNFVVNFFFSIVHQSCGYPLKISALWWREDVSGNMEKSGQGEGGGLALSWHPFQFRFYERSEGICKSFYHHHLLKCKEVNKK